ncbi:ISXoc2 transposase, IS3 family protein [Rhodanobacter sp. 115]|nr:ISXoc2 transposase, IS3 family protein [Rhodanobacter sp. 115]
MEMAALDWAHWFNHKRLLGPVGNIPPAEAGAAYYRQQVEPPTTAWLKPNSLRKTQGVQSHPASLPRSPMWSSMRSRPGKPGRWIRCIRSSASTLQIHRRAP